MTSLTRVRRLERVLADWFEKSTNGTVYDGTPQLLCDITNGSFSLHAPAEELDMALDGIIRDEMADRVSKDAADQLAEFYASRR